MDATIPVKPVIPVTPVKPILTCKGPCNYCIHKKCYSI